MAKITLNNLANLQNETTAVNIINGNNDAIETFSDDVISRTGKTPNVMESQLDMNSNHIINLPAPLSDNDPVRLIDVTTITEPATGNVTSLATPSGGEAAVFSGTSGKIITNYTGNGIVKATAGVLSTAAQGTDYYAPGGTDVAIADGGTSASTAPTAFDNLKQSSTDSYQGVVELATTSEANAGTDTTRAVTPAGVDAYYNGHINTSLAPYSLITRNIGSFTSNYTLVLSDAGRVLNSGNTSAATVTIPFHTSVAFPTGTQIDFIRNNIGKVTFAGVGGVSILSKNGLLSLSDLYAACTLVYAGTNGTIDWWWLFGDLAS